MDIRQDKIGKYIFTRDKKDVVFRIPDYQRPYVWDTERVEEFWKDLLDSQEMHLPFIGSFIFKDEDGVLDIVDGQQRIMTIHLLLAALRDFSREYGESSTLVDKIQERLSDTTSLGRPVKYTLTCWDDVDFFLKEYILSGEKTSNDIKNQKAKKKTEVSKYNILANYSYFFDELIPGYVTDMDPHKVDIAISEIVDDKIHDLEFVYIKVLSDEDAYTAFEIVNARGQELGNIDLIKNLFFKNAAAADDKPWAVSQWGRLIRNTEDLPKVDSEIFLRHFWLSMRGGKDFITSKRLFRCIKSLMSSSENYKTLLEKIADNSEIYGFLYDPDQYEWVENHKYNAEISDHLKNIRLFGVTQPNILFLSIVRNRKKFTERTIRNIFRMIEVFHFTYSVVGRGPANQIEKVYAKYAEIIETSPGENDDLSNIYNELNDILSNILDHRITREIFIKGFQEIGYGKKDIVRYVYSILERNYGTKQIKIDWINANIEHIEPQKNGENGFDEYAVNNIGNLVILGVECNSRVGNKSILEKVEIYKEDDCCQLKIVQSMLAFLEKHDLKWTKELVGERAKNLAEDVYDGFVMSGEVFRKK